MVILLTGGNSLPLQVPDSLTHRELGDEPETSNGVPGIFCTIGAETKRKNAVRTTNIQIGSRIPGSPISVATAIGVL